MDCKLSGHRLKRILGYVIFNKHKSFIPDVRGSKIWTKRELVLIWNKFSCLELVLAVCQNTMNWFKIRNWFWTRTETILVTVVTPLWGALRNLITTTWYFSNPDELTLGSESNELRVKLELKSLNRTCLPVRMSKSGLLVLWSPDPSGT